MSETTYDSDGNIIEQVVDNGDGTGVRRTYDASGNITSEENIICPVHEATVEALVQVPTSALEELKIAAETPGSDIRAALVEFASKVMGQ